MSRETAFTLEIGLVGSSQGRDRHTAQANGRSEFARKPGEKRVQWLNLAACPGPRAIARRAAAHTELLGASLRLPPLLKRGFSVNWNLSYTRAYPLRTNSSLTFVPSSKIT